MILDHCYKPSGSHSDKLKSKFIVIKKAVCS